MAKRIISKEYVAFLEQIKARVTTSWYQAALAVNREMLLLYHHIGSEIIRHQKTPGKAENLKEIGRAFASQANLQPAPPEAP